LWKQGRLHMRLYHGFKASEARPWCFSSFTPASLRSIGKQDQSSPTILASLERELPHLPTSLPFRATKPNQSQDQRRSSNRDEFDGETQGLLPPGPSSPRAFFPQGSLSPRALYPPGLFIPQDSLSPRAFFPPSRTMPSSP
jgi:hypothetical protein